ncbi:MAG: FAD-dependent oxidoreductase [Rhabdochlamydiaceae bacterium]|nr:FAD-dependent oxidoreductase [Rhabdochlamydiaceae bacterium]
MKKVVIVGGGVAGLSALNRLADLGISATLIEAGTYPSHKICGEFFSPECLPILSAWDIEPTQKIPHISLVTSHRTLSFPLPNSARSQSRFTFDHKLVQRAEKNGAIILTKTKVKDIKKNHVLLDNETMLPYTDLIVSSGRFFGRVSSPLYAGLKGYFRGLDIQGLEMYPFPGGYAGLSPSGDGLSNFTCLMPKHYDKEMLFKAVPHLQSKLQKGEFAYDEWMTCKIPAFGIKKTPSQANTYFVGDAAGTIPPASGLGLSIALTSGYMAAEYAVKGDREGFQKAWHSRYKKTFAYGHVLHWLLTHPSAYHSALGLERLFPKLPLTIFSKTRLFKI